MDQLEEQQLQQAALSRKLLEAEVIARAWEDEAFRAKLEADPVVALTEAGIEPPAGKAIETLTEETDTIILVVPPKPAPSDEVGDADLEAVAGGGLRQDGKCHVYDNSRKPGTTATHKLLGIGAVVFGSAIGVSWGWG